MKTLFTIFVIIFSSISFSAQAETSLEEILAKVDQVDMINLVIEDTDPNSAAKKMVAHVIFKDLYVNLEYYVVGADKKMLEDFMSKAVIRTYKTVGTEDMALVDDAIVASFQKSCFGTKLPMCKFHKVNSDTTK